MPLDFPGSPNVGDHYPPTSPQWQWDGVKWATFPGVPLGTMSAQNANAVAITGGAVDGTTLGATTPAPGSFTTLTASSAPSGAGITALFASPPPIGNTAPAAGSFTTLTASGAVSGAGFTARFASPGPIGNTTPSSGAFTTLTASGGATFTSVVAANAVNVGISPNCLVGLSPGNTTLTGYIGFWNAAGSTLYAYIGQVPVAGGLLQLLCQNGCTGLNITGTAAVSGTLSVTGVISGGSNITAVGQVTCGVVAAANVGRAALTPGGASNTGYMSLWHPNGTTRMGYIGFAPAAGGTIGMVSEGGTTGWAITGSLGISTTLGVTGLTTLSGGCNTATLTCNSFTVNGIMTATAVGRLVCVGSGAYASVSAYNTGYGVANGMWCQNNSPNLFFGSVDGSGGPLAVWMQLSSTTLYMPGSGADFFILTNAPYRSFYYGQSAGYYWQWSSSSGDMQWVIANATQWYMRVSDGLCYASRGSGGGNGAYVNISDERVKECIEPSPYGLEEILQLNPKRFRRLIPGRDTPLELGFSAQDIQKVIPEAVTKIGSVRPFNDGDDDDDPFLGIHESALIPVLVNAVQTLTARVASLEGSA